MRKRIRALLAHRQTVGRVGGFAVTVAFALYNGILGAIYASIWHGSICLYYLLLSALRGILLSAVRRPARERRAFRCTSLLLPVLDLALTVPAAMMVLDRKPVQIGQIPAIGMAAYTTYKVVLAAIGLKRSKRTESLAEKALRTIAFTDALVSVLTFGMNIILKAYEPAAATVFGVYFKLQSFVYMPVFGMNNGIVPIIAYNYGAGKPKRITDTLKLGVICSVVIMIVGLLLFQLIPVQLLGMFAPTDDMIRLGETALRIFSVSFVFAGVSIVLSSGFQALGNGFYSMIVFIVRLIVPTLPLAWLFGIIGGVDCIWWSLPVSDLLGLIVAILLMRRIYKNVISKMYDKQDESSAQVQQA